jgi:XTP/dITP diphosphohydrolase
MAIRATLVTSNPHKFAEIRRILAPYGVTLHRRDQRLPEPQSARLEDVVSAKLGATRKDSGYVLVEDSGIFFEGLGGFPGVYSAYVYDTVGLPGVIRLLTGRSRKARFRTVAGIRRGARTWMCSGSTDGRASSRLRGRGGFGYDPIFLPDGRQKTFAELSPAEKDAISHRGRAFRRVGRLLQRLERERTIRRRT